MQVAQLDTDFIKISGMRFVLSSAELVYNATWFSVRTLSACSKRSTSHPAVWCSVFHNIRVQQICSRFPQNERELGMRMMYVGAMGCCETQTTSGSALLCVLSRGRMSGMQASGFRSRARIILTFQPAISTLICTTTQFARLPLQCSHAHVQGPAAAHAGTQLCPPSSDQCQALTPDRRILRLQPAEIDMRSALYFGSLRTDFNCYTLWPAAGGFETFPLVTSPHVVSKSL